VKKGTSLAIVGGKSTLFRVLLNLICPYSGTIKWKEK
jgi:ABC-type Mn2+/Zn2+ transport system ATPase subunit